MRENRLSGSEGGGTLIGSPYPYRKASRPIFSHLLAPWASRQGDSPLTRLTPSEPLNLAPMGRWPGLR
jgi:hypothetical protein